MQKELEEGQIILCIVKNIEGTAVFCKIEDYDKEATLVTSEVAPGRIRNLRDYVVPNKKIVCKILRIEKSGNIHLSLRRVTAKERKEVLEIYEKERNLAATIKTISKEAENIIKKIKQESSLVEFLEQAKQEPKLLENLMSKEETEKLLKILKEKKEKEVIVKKKFSLKSEAEDGIVRIKRVLPEDKNIIYLAAGRFSIEIKNKDYKDANAKLQQILQNIEKKAKQEGCAFSAEK